MKSKVKVISYWGEPIHKVGLPEYLKYSKRRYKYYLNRKSIEKKDKNKKRFGDQHHGSYHRKRISKVILPLWYLSFDKFYSKKEKYIDQIKSIKRNLEHQYIFACKYEGTDLGVLKGEDYGGYGTWADIFGTLSYISDRWNCANRISYLLDLLKQDFTKIEEGTDWEIL